MKITVSSDDGARVVNVTTDDIDWSGHSLNKAVLEHRVAKAISDVVNYENREHAGGSVGLGNAQV